jgi:hypothetical protein
MSGEVSGMLWTFGSLAATALLIVVVAWPVGVIMRARVAAGREERYRKLAESAIEAQQAAGQRLAEIRAELGVMRTHMAALERVLTEVE